MVFQMGTIESLQGPVAVRLGGIDLSWLAGIGTSSVAYFVFHKLRGKADEHLIPLSACGE